MNCVDFAGPEAGLLLLPGPLLSGRVALHAAGLPGRQLCALLGCQVQLRHLLAPAGTPTTAAAYFTSIYTHLNIAKCKRTVSKL